MTKDEATEILGMQPYDAFLICRKVIEKGYDSIQIYNNEPPYKQEEFVYCTGKCATEPVGSACPPLELKTGWNATKKCVCNDTFPIVNCNNKITDTAECFDIKQPEFRYKQTCYFEGFNWINTFETDWDGSIAIFFLWDRKNLETRNTLLPKLKTIINTHNQGGWSTIVVDSGLMLLNSVTNHTLALEAMKLVGFDIVPILRRSEHAILNRDKYQFQMLSLTVPGFLRSTVLKRAGVKIGFISYSMHSLNADSLDKMAQLVLDEALCLKRQSDIIILLSASEVFADTYIAKKVGKFVDMIVGGNAQEHQSCSDRWHKNSESEIIHSKHDGSYITMISIDVIDKSRFAFKSDILDTTNIREDEDVKSWMMNFSKK